MVVSLSLSLVSILTPTPLNPWLSASHFLSSLFYPYPFETRVIRLSLYFVSILPLPLWIQGWQVVPFSRLHLHFTLTPLKPGLSLSLVSVLPLPQLETRVVRLSLSLVSILPLSLWIQGWQFVTFPRLHFTLTHLNQGFVSLSLYLVSILPVPLWIQGCQVVTFPRLPRRSLNFLVTYYDNLLTY